MIYIDETQTICQCDRCAVVTTTANPNGKVPAGWGTGQFWLDVSLSEQRQSPLAFCPTCYPVMMTAEAIQISATVTGLPTGGPTLEDLRARTSRTRLEFCDRCLAMDVLTLPEAKQAAKGEIPDSFKPLLETFSQEDQDRLEYRWAAASVIDRNDPFIIQLGELKGLTPEDLDALFGVGVA